MAGFYHILHNLLHIWTRKEALRSIQILNYGKIFTRFIFPTLLSLDLDCLLDFLIHHCFIINMIMIHIYYDFMIHVLFIFYGAHILE